MYSFVQQGSESVSPFHLFHLFTDWSELVGVLVVVCLLGFVGLVFFCCLFFVSLTNLLIELSNHDYFSIAL